MLWDTPGRLNEIARIEMSGLDLNRDAGAFLVMGKGRRERWMPLGAVVQDAIWEYLGVRAPVAKGQGDLWLSADGKPMKTSWLYQMIKRTGIACGIPVHPHQFRHNFAMAALESEMSEQALKLIGGWKKIPPTYFGTAGKKQAIMAHKTMSPADKLRQQAGRGRGPQQGKARGRL